MDRIHAPYGFVPASAAVFLPRWAPAATQDIPFEDGVCGTLGVRLVAESPMFVRGSGDREQFFRTPDGYAIPGSSLRGLLRNVVEIASFGWMRRVNDNRYGIRDLHNQDLYVQHMAGIQESVQGERRPLPRVMAGWLRRRSEDAGGPDDVVAEIVPCNFAKIEYRLLARMTGTRHDFGRRQSSVDKYRAWGSVSREVRVAVRDLRTPEAVRLPFGFGEVTGPGAVEGTLVFTGQPAPWRADAAPRRGGGQPKHHDFVFHGRNAAHALPVTRRLMDGFEFVHSDGGEQRNLGRAEARNVEWHHWGKEYDAFRDVPVFFLLDEQRSTPRRPVLRAMGLAMMFRLAYDHTTGDAVHNAQPVLKIKGDTHLDLAETLFGHVPAGRRTDPLERRPLLKGRVSIGLARAVGSPRPDGPVQVVLGSPKASYYPNYVEQRDTAPGLGPNRNRDGKPLYRTYMNADVKVRGWKRYRPQGAVVTPPLPRRGDGSSMDLSRVGTTFHPLPAGSVFEAEIRLHNVRPAEVGALLWALEFGGDAECRHTLGLARPLGYGACRFEVGESTLRDMDEAPLAGLDGCRKAFANAMEEFCKSERVPGGWAGSRQIFELRALARPIPAGSVEGTHMRIDHPEYRNEFQRAKLEGLVLPTAGSEGVWRESVGLAAVAPRADSPASAPRILPTVTAIPPWVGLRGGTRVQVTLNGQTKKGKWRAKLDAHPAEGVVSFGEVPEGVVDGQKHTVTVTAGGNPRDIQMKWE